MPRKELPATEWEAEFIRTHHSTFNVEDFREELGCGLKRVLSLFKQLGLKRLGRLEVTINRFKQCPEFSVEQLAKAYKMSVNYVGDLVRENGLPNKFESRKDKSGTDHKNSRIIVFDGKPMTEDEAIKLLDKKEKERKNRRKSFNTLNQTKSPFGFSDKLKGRKIV